MSKIKRVFKANGKPFYPLGGQAKNSSGYNQIEAEKAFKVVEALHGNTLEVPVYWNQVEPEEGKFDFNTVDTLLDMARKRGVHLILLWFGTWKNGTMNYTPSWVKTNPQRFKRVLSPSGTDLWVLSSHCNENFDADKRAFITLCGHLKDMDSKEGTVIALQVENEPGIIGSDRDYSIEAESTFNRKVPTQLVAMMKAKGSGQVYDLWLKAGGLESGNWADLFGHAAGELMTAWSIAGYIDQVANAGKRIIKIPMYINVWLMEQQWWSPGENYPSGGAVSKTLDIYKWYAPHIDLIAPDIYLADSKSYESICSIYSRADNPFFVPESGSRMNERNMFRAIADYNAIGYHIFGIEHILDEHDVIYPDFQMLVESFRCVSAIIPLLLKYQGTDKVHSVVQDEGMLSQLIDFDGYYGLVQFGNNTPQGNYKDWRHTIRQTAREVNITVEYGRGLAIQTGPHEFYFVGDNYRLFLRRKMNPKKTLDASLSNAYMLNRLSHYISVDEGHFKADGEFVIDRRRNGDETDYGLWLEPDIGVLHVIMVE